LGVDAAAAAAAAAAEAAASAADRDASAGQPTRYTPTIGKQLLRDRFPGCSRRLQIALHLAVTYWPAAPVAYRRPLDSHLVSPSSRHLTRTHVGHRAQWSHAVGRTPTALTESMPALLLPCCCFLVLCS
jgi:hypothetical protein